MTNKKVDKRILALCKKVTAKRARVVIDHIIKHGFITNEELDQTYGYNHPPRAARDVREQGIPLETFKVRSKTGRSIAAYRFGNLDQIEAHKLGGRQVFSKEFKKTLLDLYGERCNVCKITYDQGFLQIDHRIPYQVVGDPRGEDPNPVDFMLVCNTCNRQKSWSCEHCINWLTKKNSEICNTCFWANPESYSHIGERNLRRIELIFEEIDLPIFEALTRAALSEKMDIGQYLKTILKSKIK